MDEGMSNKTESTGKQEVAAQNHNVRNNIIKLQNKFKTTTPYTNQKKLLDRIKLSTDKLEKQKLQNHPYLDKNCKIKGRRDS